MILRIHELVTDVNELDRESAWGSATCVRNFRPVVM